MPAFLVTSSPSVIAGTYNFDGSSTNTPDTVPLANDTLNLGSAFVGTGKVSGAGAYDYAGYDGNSNPGEKTIAVKTSVTNDSSVSQEDSAIAYSLNGGQTAVPIVIEPDASQGETTGESVQVQIAATYSGSTESDPPASLNSNLYVVSYEPPGSSATTLLNGTDNGQGGGGTVSNSTSFDTTIGATFLAGVYLVSTNDTALGQSTVTATLSMTITVTDLVSKPKTLPPTDFDGSGRSDISIYLPNQGAFAYRPADGGADQIIPFGTPGAGNSLPSPGNFDGAGKTELGVYLPAMGAFAYRPADGGADQIIPFGTPGIGQDIPAVGDYDGSGKDQVGVYLPTLGDYAYRPDDGMGDQVIQFGMAGEGNSIPVPGDYFGDGHDDIAVYMPTVAAYAILDPSTGQNEIVPFGMPGLGNSIPVPGDYDGSGKTELAVYLPTLGVFAYRPADGGPDQDSSFGSAGEGASIPDPGDYDGTGKTDFGVYLPSAGGLAFQGDGGQNDQFVPFGTPGAGQVLPASAVTASYIYFLTPPPADNDPNPGLYNGTFQANVDLTDGETASGGLSVNLGVNPDDTIDGAAAITQYPVVSDGVIIATEDSISGYLQGKFQEGENASAGTFTFNFPDDVQIIFQWQGTLTGSTFSGTLFGTDGSPAGTFNLTH